MAGPGINTAPAVLKLNNGPGPLAEEHYLVQSRHVLFLYSRFLVAGPGINTAPAVLKLNNGPGPLAEEYYLVQSRHVLFYILVF